MSRCVALIPARYGSTRLPGKPLLKETGKYLIQHVHERVRAARRLDQVIVATDDARIVAAVNRFGGEAVLTDPAHPSGSDRVAEAARDLAADFIVNVQGDEPEIAPELLDEMVALLAADDEADVVTPACPLTETAALSSPHVVKVVLGADHRALYFSRAPIPHGAGPQSLPAPLKHIGVYAYRKASLLRMAALPPVPLETTERLEQLRALYHGMRIRVVVTDRDHHGIDTPEEYAAFVKRYKETQSQPMKGV